MSRDRRRRGLFVGLCTLDSVYRVRGAPGPNDKIVATAHDVAAGGPATGAAVTFAALGGHATLLTVLGQHVIAAWARDELGQRGVAVRDAAPEWQHAPPMSSVYVDELTGDRSVVSLNATGRGVDAPDLVPALVGEADVVLVDGHYPPLCLRAAQLAHERGVPVILDGGSWTPALRHIVPHIDIAACSAQFRWPGTTSVPDSARALLAEGVPAVATTRGALPVLFWTPQINGEVPVPQVTVCDTLGAGDAFHGALAAALDQDGLPEAIRTAVRVASIRVTVPGPRAWLDTGLLPKLLARPGA